MKKSTAAILIAIIVIVIFFIPFSKEVYEDGGTQVTTALTYRVVRWNKEGYEPFTRVYLFPKNFEIIDNLWRHELSKIQGEDSTEDQDLDYIVVPEGLEEVIR